MSANVTNRSGLTRRDALKLGAGAAAGTSVLSLLASPAFAQDQVLRVIHGGFDMDWSPMRGGGRPVRWQSLWWASPMYFDSEANIHPYVVSEWSSNDDQSVWTFSLDPDAVFSDGSPITAADIKGSWELAAMPSSRHGRVNLVISGVEGYDDIVEGRSAELPGAVVVDDHTLEVTLTRPDPIFFMRIANHLIPIVKASEARDENGEEILEWWAPGSGGVTSGPFRIVELNLDDGFLAFEPNENFFGPTPQLGRIEIRVIEDAVTATNLLQRGEYDAHTELVTSTIVSDLGEEFARGPSIPTGQHFWFNVNTPPFDDVNVRQALILAVDRDGLMRASFPDGPHAKADQILVAVPDVDEGYEPFPYDPEEARRLLAESEYGGPERLPRIVMAGMTTPANSAAAQYIIEQWRQNLGITAVDIRPTQDNLAPGDVHVFRDDASSRVPDAVALLMGSIHSSSGIATTQMNGYNNPEVDALLDQAATLAVDDPERTELVQQAQRLFREDYAFIPWYHETMSRWANENVEGMDKNSDWQVYAPWNISKT